MFADLLRESLSTWPLYTPDDHVMVVERNELVAIEYCGRCESVPFTARSRLAAEPPNLLSLNKCGDILNLVFIQIERKHRGKGHGAALYDAVCRFARCVGCKEVSQTHSGGYRNQTRAEYLEKRGWSISGPLAFRYLG